MADPDLASLSTTALIIERDIAGVAGCLSVGSGLFFRTSRRGAQTEALRLAQAARERLDALIKELGEP